MIRTIILTLLIIFTQVLVFADLNYFNTSKTPFTQRTWDDGVKYGCSIDGKIEYIPKIEIDKVLKKTENEDYEVEVEDNNKLLRKNGIYKILINGGREIDNKKWYVSDEFVHCFVGKTELKLPKFYLKKITFISISGDTELIYENDGREEDIAYDNVPLMEPLRQMDSQSVNRVYNRNRYSSKLKHRHDIYEKVRPGMTLDQVLTSVGNPDRYLSPSKGTYMIDGWDLYAQWDDTRIYFRKKIVIKIEDIY